MESSGYISLTITGKTADEALNPKDINISETKETDFKHSDEKLQKLIKKASTNWKDIKDKDSWLNEIRGL